MYRRRFFIKLSIALAMFVLASGQARALEAIGWLDYNNAFDVGQDLLHPEEAFRFSHALEADGILRLSWDIAEGYYLYRDKFAAISDSVEVAVGELELPPGIVKDDPDFGNVAIYKKTAHLSVPIAVGANAPSSLPLRVTYQGCAEDRICYPPIKKDIQIFIGSLLTPLRAAGASDTVARSVSPIMSADAIAARLTDRSFLAVVAAFFVFGLALSFTPCVFPMVPILSGIIVGQARATSFKRGLALSAVYVLAVAVTYALIGLLAGLFGHNLQAISQQPIVLIGFSLVFIVLALSMFGFYTLQLPSALQTHIDRYSRSQEGSNFLGVAVMGVLSAIIVGPCVAPPLAGALIYLGHQGSPLVGGAALFSMGIGMGVPLLAVGASMGKLLPRTGPWMEVVKRVFGVALLGVAIWFLGRILPGPVSLFLWALLIITMAVFVGALAKMRGPTPAWRRLSKGVGLALLCYGAVLIVGAGVGADDPFDPLKPLTRDGGEKHELAFASIKGLAGLTAEFERARALGQPVMLDFYADWCVECKYMERDTFADRDVEAALSAVVLLRADVTANDEVDQSLLRNFDLFGPPAILFFDPHGAEYRKLRVVGFVGPADFSAHITQLTGRRKL